MPAKSRPGVRGRVVFLKCPATFPMSLGLMAAAFTSTSASPSLGSGIATSSNRSTEGGPKAVKRNDFIIYAACNSIRRITAEKSSSLPMAASAELTAAARSVAGIETSS
jgi:hypothetical protein